MLPTSLKAIAEMGIDYVYYHMCRVLYSPGVPEDNL